MHVGLWRSWLPLCCCRPIHEAPERRYELHGQVSTEPGGLTSLWIRHQRWLPVAMLIAALALAVVAWMLRDYVSPTKVAGYPGVFLISFVGAVSLVLPVPAMLTVCGLSATLDPFVLGSLAGLGESLGEWSGYAVGYGGHSLFERLPVYRAVRPKMRSWMEKRGGLLLFVVSAIPNPVFDIVGIAAGTVQYPFARFMAIVFVGKIIKGLLIAYSCHYGVALLPWVE